MKGCKWNNTECDYTDIISKQKKIYGSVVPSVCVPDKSHLPDKTYHIKVDEE